MAALRALERILRDGQSSWVAGWADRVAVVAEDVENGDVGAAPRLLEMYGGMGSLNDIWLAGGTDEEERRANQRLSQLREQAWSLASTIVRETDDAAADGSR